MIRVLICSEIRLYREALAETLALRRGFEVLDPRACPCLDAGEVKRLQPDVFLLDALIVDARAVARRVIAARPRTEIVMLTASGSDQEFVDFAEAGVSGFVRRDGSLDDLVGVIRQTMRGEMHCSPSALKRLARRVATRADEAATSVDSPHVTPRELEIAALIDEGLSNKGIARRLGIEVSTVKNHVHNMLEKLQVHRRGEAAARLRHLMSSSAGSRSTVGLRNPDPTDHRAHPVPGSARRSRSSRGRS